MARSLIWASFFIFIQLPISWAGLSDFDLSNNQVDIKAFSSGGPAKDGIPALSQPTFIDADQATYLKDDDVIIGLQRDGHTKAYPVAILNWHEIINDEIAGTPVAVTWCPLTRSAVTFDRRIKGETLEFGVSGLLYNSNVVMYDRNTDGLWSQLKSGGLTGKYSQEPLKRLPVVESSWGTWKKQHPDTVVLSNKTGHWRNYAVDPYHNYHQNSHVMFPVKNADDRLDQKNIIIGINFNNTAKAYSLDQIDDFVQDTIDGRDIQITKTGTSTAIVEDKDGNRVPSVVAYWFAWVAFHENSLLYKN